MRDALHGGGGSSEDAEEDRAQDRHAVQRPVGYEKKTTPISINIINKRKKGHRTDTLAQSMGAQKGSFREPTL